MNVLTYIKSFLALTLIAAFLMRPMELPIKKAWQLISPESFEAKYCQNLDYPELDCHGSCHLEKIASANLPIHHAQISAVQLSMELFFHQPELAEIPNLFLAEKAKLLPYAQRYAFSIYSDIFHPPKLS